jgi:hypothetical protein
MFYRIIYDLNFLALGTLSPLNILSAPTFLPLLGQPYFGPKTLQELPHKRKLAKAKTRMKFRAIFISIISTDINAFKSIKIIPQMQYHPSFYPLT